MMNLKIGKWKWSYLKQKEKWLCVKVLCKLQHSILTDQISRSVMSDSLRPHNGFLSRPKLTSFLCIWTDIIVCKLVPSRFSLLTSALCFPQSKKKKKKNPFFPPQLTAAFILLILFFPASRDSTPLHPGRLWSALPSISCSICTYPQWPLLSNILTSPCNQILCSFPECWERSPETLVSTLGGCL